MNTGDVIIMTVRIKDVLDLIGEVTEIRDYKTYREIVFHKPYLIGKGPQDTEPEMIPISQINPLIGDDIVFSNDAIIMYYSPKKQQAERYRALRSGIVPPSQAGRRVPFTR
jgi:hypothetical protein